MERSRHVVSNLPKQLEVVLREFGLEPEHVWETFLRNRMMGRR